MAKADAVVRVDTREAQSKLDNVIKKLKYIHALINKSWLLRLFFYGIFRKQNNDDTDL